MTTSRRVHAPAGRDCGICHETETGDPPHHGLSRPIAEGCFSCHADLEALVGCVAGAVLVEEIRADAEAAGLADIRLEAKSGYIDAMTDWQDPLYRRIVDALPHGSRVGDYITSLDVTAVRP